MQDIPSDANVWKKVLYLHREGFMDLQPLTDGDYGYRINFADVHRMYLRFLQAKLIDRTVSLQFKPEGFLSDNNMGDLGCVLRQYIQAVRDLECMAKYSGHWNDPFVASAERSHEEHLLSDAMLRASKTASDFSDKFKDNAIPTGPWEDGDWGGGTTLGTTRAAIRKRALWSKIAGALLGGTFLIGPMWLLALERDLHLQLGLTTGCVLAFGTLMAWYLNTVEAVFASSIAYAAVLMVFIGAMMQENGNA
ncbi:hypothetical protein BJY04DRAFT_216025 [Aspergillus karnatakaensis]|uniref:uncharacterized protein n=1 Tax=Aspergillus karnatakaensis TaxID=1810916 RepID=UPI003CCD0C1C